MPSTDTARLVDATGYYRLLNQAKLHEKKATGDSREKKKIDFQLTRKIARQPEEQGRLEGRRDAFESSAEFHKTEAERIRRLMMVI
jgi:hypothetical protein